MPFFGPALEWKLEPQSVPYVVYRNIEGYRSQSHISPLATQSEFISSAWDGAMFYKHKIRDNPIPGNLLINSLLEDSLLSRHQQLNQIHTSKNSVLGTLLHNLLSEILFSRLFL
jgi:hypothetical protein